MRSAPVDFLRSKFHVVGSDIVGEVNAISNHGGARVSAVKGGSPKYLRSILREFFEQPGFFPDIVTAGAHPVWPVVSLYRCENKKGKVNHKDRSKHHLPGS